MYHLAVVIPVHDQWDLTRACLESLAEHTPGGFWQVIVVDNGSGDATPSECPALLERLFGERGVHLRLEENTGFGPACNAGAHAADAEFVFFLNNDTEALPRWPDPLFKALADDPRLGAVSPLLLYPDSRRVQHLGIALDPNLHTLHLFEGFPGAHPAALRPRVLQAVSAAALFMPRDLFLQHDGFHEGFVNGSEDMDLCCRLSRSGMRVACEPRSVLLHHGSRTEGRFDHARENARLVDRRCRGCFATDLHRFARQEGFGLRLTPWLEPYLVPGEPLRWDGDVLELPELLAVEPLFEAGYVRLVDHLEGRGELDAALDWQELLAGFYPTETNFLRAAGLAREAGHGEALGRWERRLSHVRARLDAPAELLERATRNRAWFAESGERELEMLYKAWLDNRTLSTLSSPIFDMFRRKG